MIRRLIERFPNFVPSGKDEQIEEFALYQTTKDLPPDIPTNTRVDVFWGKMGKLESTSGKPFGLLSDFAKCLCIPHGNAGVYCVFLMEMQIQNLLRQLNSD